MDLVSAGMSLEPAAQMRVQGLRCPVVLCLSAAPAMRAFDYLSQAGRCCSAATFALIHSAISRQSLPASAIHPHPGKAPLAFPDRGAVRSCREWSGGQADGMATLTPQKSRTLEPRACPVSRFVAEAKFGRERLPGAIKMSEPVGPHRQRMERVQQPVSRPRHGKALGPRPLGHQTRRKMGGDAPGQGRIPRRCPAERRGGVNRDEARRGSDAFAVVVRLKERGLGEGVAGPGAVQDGEAAFRGEPPQLQRALADDHQAERGIANAEQGLAAGEAAVVTLGQLGEQVGVHVIMIIRIVEGLRLPHGAKGNPDMAHRAVVLVLALLLATPVPAQQDALHHHAGAAGAAHPGAPAQPYGMLQGRRIKALSAEQEAGLRAGRGMEMALAAELNGYPGPLHVLEHAEALRLTPAQRAAAEALRQRMLGEAQTIGTRIVTLEEELDLQFRNGQVDAGRLAVLTAELGALNGRLREAHLVTHIEMRAALEPAQREAYSRLRGYTAP